MIKTATRPKWTPTLKKVYQKYPASIRSGDWPRIIALSNSGDVSTAMELAARHEGQNKSHRAQNVIARRLRIQRVALFALQKQTIQRIKDAFKISADALSNKVQNTALTHGNIGRFRKSIHDVTIDLRRAVNTIITDTIWAAIIMGVKNMGEAIKPILRDNQESFQEELLDVALIEERLTFGMEAGFSGRAKGSVVMGSDKWTAILDNLYVQIAKKSISGMTLSERIWDLTNRMEMDLRRTVSTDIAMGVSARTISDKIQKYIYVNGLDEEYQSGPGIYKSPMKNALRLARTETSRAYSNATAAWAQEKDWVKGIQITLSPAHDQADECDDLAGEIVDAAEFADIIPAHPHCMCFGVYVIDESNLVQPDTSDQEDVPAEEE